MTERSAPLIQKGGGTQLLFAGTGQFALGYPAARLRAERRPPPVCSCQLQGSRDDSGSPLLLVSCEHRPTPPVHCSPFDATFRPARHCETRMGCGGRSLREPCRWRARDRPVLASSRVVFRNPHRGIYPTDTDLGFCYRLLAVQFVPSTYTMFVHGDAHDFGRAIGL